MQSHDWYSLSGGISSNNLRLFCGIENRKWITGWEMDNWVIKYVFRLFSYFKLLVHFTTNDKNNYYTHLVTRHTGYTS